MAKGEGGGGHFDERRRAKLKPTTGYYDDPAVLEAIVKPRTKPLVVERKQKKKVMVPQPKPSRVKVESDAGEVPEFGVPMRTTRLNVNKSRHMPMAPPKPRLRPGAAAAEERMRDPVNPDWFRSGALAAELRMRDPVSVKKAWRPPGGGKSLASWLARLKLDI